MQFLNNLVNYSCRQGLSMSDFLSGHLTTAYQRPVHTENIKMTWKRGLIRRIYNIEPTLETAKIF